MKADLFASEAPITVNNFVFLARQGYYDGVAVSSHHQRLHGPDR